MKRDSAGMQEKSRRQHQKQVEKDILLHQGVVDGVFREGVVQEEDKDNELLLIIMMRMQMLKQ
jgi:hypothetical protein